MGDFTLGLVFFWRRRRRKEGLNRVLSLSYFRMVALKGPQKDFSAHRKMEFNQY